MTIVDDGDTSIPADSDYKTFKSKYYLHIEESAVVNYFNRILSFQDCSFQTQDNGIIKPVSNPSLGKYLGTVNASYKTSIDLKNNSFSEAQNIDHDKKCTAEWSRVIWGEYYKLGSGPDKVKYIQYDNRSTSSGSILHLYDDVVSNRVTNLNYSISGNVQKGGSIVPNLNYTKIFFDIKITRALTSGGYIGRGNRWIIHKFSKNVDGYLSNWILYRKDGGHLKMIRIGIKKENNSVKLVPLDPNPSRYNTSAWSNNININETNIETYWDKTGSNPTNYNNWSNNDTEGGYGVKQINLNVVFNVEGNVYAVNDVTQNNFYKKTKESGKDNIGQLPSYITDKSIPFLV